MQHCRPSDDAVTVSYIVLGCTQACTVMSMCEASQQCLLMLGINWLSRAKDSEGTTVEGGRGTHAFMMTMMLVLVLFRVPCNSTWGPPTHSLLVGSAICVLKNISCTCMPSCQGNSPIPQRAPRNNPRTMLRAHKYTHAATCLCQLGTDRHVLRRPCYQKHVVQLL